jgi:undecaprenyl diphosphate synthase
MIKHLGLIPDGNRRWAIEQRKTYTEAYEFSARHLVEFVEYLLESGIQTISIYLLSLENLKRTEADLDPVFRAGLEFLEKIFDICNKYKCKVNHAGIKNLLPDNLNEEIKKLTIGTSIYTDLKLNLLIAYNPFLEINDAFMNKKGIIEISDLWVNEYVDVVVRTGGGNIPLSNFLPLQSAYSQSFIVEKYFNDFSTTDLRNILELSLKASLSFGK